MATDLFIVIAAGFCGGVLARLVRQPLVLGYLVAGIVVGPHTGGITVADPQNLERLAEIGATLLLFGLGLELSLKDLAPVRRIALLGTPIQIGLTIALGVPLGRWLGFGWRESVWLGALVSLSSTLVVLKALQTQGRMGTLSSRVMLGMLIAQDLTFIPLMVILPGLGGGGTGASTAPLVMVRAAVLLVFLIAVATRAFPRLVGWVARSGSRELFLLVTMGIALGIGYLAHWLGVSSAVGAFVAGLVLSESDYSHQALSDIIPLRDVFSLLFFASVGMLLDPDHVLGQWRVIALTAGVVSLAKGGIFWGVARAFGYRNVVPLASALALFGIGEFSFVLARAGLASGSISEALYALVLNTAVITMVLTPVVSGLTTPVYAWISRRREREPVQTINLPSATLRDHIIVAGAGRVGWQVAGVLHTLNLPHVLIDLDPRRIDRAREEGRPAIFGDAAQQVVLEAAGVSGARLLLVTIPMIGVARSAIECARRLNPAISVVVRAENAEAIAALNSLNVTEVIQPELEAGLEMTRQALAHLQMPALEIVHLADQLRADHYGSAYDRYAREYGIVGTLSSAARHLDLRWVRIQEGSALAGRTIGETGIRSSIGVTIVGIVGAQGFQINPAANRPFMAGDAVAVVGERVQIDAFESAAQPVPAGS